MEHHVRRHSLLCVHVSPSSGRANLPSLREIRSLPRDSAGGHARLNCCRALWNFAGTVTFLVAAKDNLNVDCEAPIHRINMCNTSLERSCISNYEIHCYLSFNFETFD